ncbi:SH3 and multiple ankyrin repeat domains protein 1 isoform X5 [Hetaerina americana]|uniref:SH3 and multiple ankyrin repeat domains protein 1 isoform X5 n=1 Tax=Hetaerina americana TaxID=62018 RepID=UPI003A7F35BA
MEGNIERDCSALGLLFQQIITDLKNGTPLWEDLISKATKLHSCLKATILAISAYLDAFQRIADSATNTKGATKEIGTALTRICLRHKAVEARVKTFTSAIMDCLVTPLQEKLEDWKKSVINLDKEHSREYKKARAELKKKSTDTLRLQKKAARKGAVGGNITAMSNNSGPGGNMMTVSCGPGGPDLQRQLDVSMADVTERRHLLEEAEQKAACAALVEERSRYCIFVACLKPVVDEEVAMLVELTHLQEVLAQLEKHTVDPYSLPEASEQVSPEPSGGSGGSDVSTPVPPGSCSSRENEDETSPDGIGNISGNSVTSPSALNTASPPLPTVASSTAATWPNLQETHQFELSSTVISGDRPHTISSAYERGHQRPPLTVYTFRPPSSTSSLDITLTPGSASQPASPSGLGMDIMSTKDSIQPGSEGSSLLQFCHRPPIPQRCSSLERPKLPSRGKHIGNESNLVTKVADRSSIKNEGIIADNKEVKPIGSDGSTLASSQTPQIVKGIQAYQQPLYVNMNELASMAAKKAQAKVNTSPPPPPPLPGQQHHSAASPGSTPLSARNLPPPPPPPHAPGALERHNSKRDLESWGESQGISLSRSSCESTGGLTSSHIFFPPEDHYSRPIQQPSNTSALLQMSHSQHEGSTTSVNRGTLLRRSSTQGPKPPPPIRRTSSISSTGGVAGGLAQLRSQCVPPVPQHFNLGADDVTSSAPPSPLPPPPPPLSRDSLGGESRGSLENLPPPPAFLLDSSDNFTHCSPKSMRSDLEPPRDNDGLCSNSPPVPIPTSVSVADAVRTLTELNHQPASPGSLRRAALSGPHPSTKPEKDSGAKGLGGSPTRANLIQALSAKLGGGVPGAGLGPAWGGTSPRRRHSEDLCNLKAGSVNTMPHPRDRGGTHHGKGPILSSSPGRGQEDFSGRGKHSSMLVADPINSRLTQQQIAQRVALQAAQRAAAAAAHKVGADEVMTQQQQQQHPSHPKAARVRQWISSRSAPDPKICHDSLMDQIRRGAPLRRTRGVVAATECPMPQLRIDN